MNQPTWLVIADSSKASIWASDPDLDDLTLVTELEHPASRVKGVDLMADDRGRTHPPGKGIARSAAHERPTSPQRVEAEAFGRELAEHLHLARTRDRYDALWLVAPPAFLGTLRDALNEPTRKSVRHTVAKNYTAKRADQLAALLRDELPS